MQKQPPRGILQKVLLKIVKNSHENTSAGVSFLPKLQDGALRLY